MTQSVLVRTASAALSLAADRSAGELVCFAAGGKSST
jgi:hypothetical protein